MNNASPIDKDVERALADTQRVLSGLSLELNKVQDHWVLTYWRTHVVLRLRIQDDEIADFDANERVIFEVKLSESNDFCELADSIMCPGTFATGINLRCRCLDGVPLAFRVESRRCSSAGETSACCVRLPQRSRVNRSTGRELWQVGCVSWWAPRVKGGAKSDHRGGERLDHPAAGRSV